MTLPRILEGEGFRIYLSQEAGYLRAQVTNGCDSQAVSVAYWTLLGNLCRETGTTRLLVVETLQDTVELTEIQPVIDAMVASGLQAVRIAFVELLDDLEGSEYGEILCRERGITIRTFNDEQAARHWLLYGQ